KASLRLSCKCTAVANQCIRTLFHYWLDFRNHRDTYWVHDLICTGVSMYKR
uniref:Cation-transporting ATPase n=1 Tax=Mesocestoides corti TaxID=53468 RepID=A0A5K3FB20_MESCO